jgi:hypothetical protein
MPPKTLNEYAADEQRDIQALQQLSLDDQKAHRLLYKRAIREAARGVQIPTPILDRLARIADRYGGGPDATFRFGRQRRLSMIESYLAARFGEDTRVWPTEIDWDGEAVRLDRWLAGVLPIGWSPESEDEE